jgi:cysteine desulfurase
MKTVYLDYAAATPIDPQVLTAMRPFFSDQFYNPSATYQSARKARAAIEQARSKSALILGVRPLEIIFTAGGTESNNLAIHGIMRLYPGKQLIVSSIEHESVLAPAHYYRHAEVPVGSDGIIDLTALEQLINDDTVLISVMYANNEIGTIQPVKEVAALIYKITAARQQAGNHLPLYLHSDATQAANYLDLHVSRLGVDLMTLNGGKIYGPKQSGLLWIRRGLELRPILDGGGQERNIRSGTENVSQIIGFNRALEKAQTLKAKESTRLKLLQQLFIKLLIETIPSCRINGSLTKRLPNNVHITIPGQDNERLLMALDEAGIMAAAGSACSASDQTPSHVLSAMGISDADARASLRFTMGRTTTAQAIRYSVDVLSRLIA